MLKHARFDLPPGELSARMADSDATGERLLLNGSFGVDVIRFPAGGRVADHIHPGSHFLFVIGGTGWVDYDSIPHRLEPGFCYLIPANVRHGIRAESELTLISVADNHRDVESPGRLELC